MGIKLIAVDMDGTLLNSRKELPGDFIPWVCEHPDIKTVIASGRQYHTLEKDFMPLKDSLVFIAENGGLVFEKGEIIYKNVMAKQDILNCIDIISKIPHATPILCGAKSAYLVEPDDEVKEQALIYYYRHDFVDNLENIIDTDLIVKVATFFKYSLAEDSIKYFENVGGNLDVVLSGDSWVDISNASVNKGNAIKAIQDKHHIDKSESMAFGDYLNDLELLQTCGESYCMANGHPTLKSVAKHITDSNDNDGVMKVLRTI